MFNNRTRNQHFIAQVEQKLNSINPSETRNRRRILEFVVNERDQLSFSITKTNGVRIEQNLSFDDLYTFEIFSDATRNNFETFFSKYESKIEQLTNNFLNCIKEKQKISSDEVMDLIFCKIMNFVRNPYSIKKVLNTFGSLRTKVPSDPYLLSEFFKITIENIKIEPNILNFLEISEEEYIDWLKIIFLFFVVEQDGKSVGELTVENFRKTSFIYINVFNYDDEICLLSDRGFVDYSPSLGESFFSMSFNLNKNSFLNFSFFEPSWENFKALIPNDNGRIALLEKHLDIRIAFPPRTEVTTISNFLDGVRNYNSNVIRQCHSNFYAAQKDFLIFKSSS
ncbi:hypothetical protein QDS01_14370 [Acinetobacter nosocomialis]|uniref:hypothetical protein n=1 Tax=Acinetobacter nosocomialis TaxID=106654 RepID=UPI00244C71A0|nr:hypothetical protein [Acinetobacter nosocomialis]MDH2636101.1 hypothetical protein [Acinetobacter nosocomialis]